MCLYRGPQDYELQGIWLLHPDTHSPACVTPASSPPQHPASLRLCSTAPASRALTFTPRRESSGFAHIATARIDRSDIYYKTCISLYRISPTTNYDIPSNPQTNLGIERAQQAVSGRSISWLVSPVLWQGSDSYFNNWINRQYLELISILTYPHLYNKNKRALV